MSPSMKPATTTTANWVMKKQTMTKPTMERTVCHGVDARHTVSRSGTGVSGTCCKGWGVIDCIGSPGSGYPLSSPINRH